MQSLAWLPSFYYWHFFNSFAYKIFYILSGKTQGSGCGSVGRAVTFEPEVRGSNPVIGKNLLISNICILSTVYWKDENKEKEAGVEEKNKKHFIHYCICKSL